MTELAEVIQKLIHLMGLYETRIATLEQEVLALKEKSNE